MISWLKKQTAAFILGCMFELFVFVYSAPIIVDWFVPLSGQNEALVLTPIFAFVVAATDGLLAWLLWGIYRKNRIALGASVVVFPFIWAVGPGSWQVANKTLDTIVLVCSMVAAVGIAGVYMRELRRNWRKR